MSGVTPSVAVAHKWVRTEKFVSSWVHILVDSAELRLTHNKVQRFFTCGRCLEDIVPDFRSGILFSCELKKSSIEEASGVQQSKTLVGGCHRDAGYRGLDHREQVVR